MSYANVFNIERFATEDGKGIRTVIFLKGCLLRCKWCANPESQSFKREIVLNTRLCIGCGKCAQLCPQKAISFKENFGYITDPKTCSGCLACVDNCFYDARSAAGTDYTVEELYEIIMKDADYYKMSGGGVTFSGGEPFFQSEIIRELGTMLKKDGITTLVETCGHVNREKIAQALDAVDYIFYDIKQMDPEKHKLLTGFDNRQIISNLEWLVRTFHGEISVRYPYIPGCNDDIGDIRSFLKYISGLEKIKEVVFLPYHRLGLPKYTGLGRVYAMGELLSLKKSDLFFLRELADEYHVNIEIQ